MEGENNEKLQPLPLLSKDVIEEILNSTAPYSDEDQKSTCKRMVDELSLEDQEVAACTSYAYWVASNFHETPPSEEIRIRMAMREARRHLVGEDGNYNNGIFALRRAIDYRKENHLNVLRTCFPTISQAPKDDTPESEKIRELYRSYLLEEATKQVMGIRGQDRNLRAIAHKGERSAPVSASIPAEGWVTVQTYYAERAYACTEYLSRGKEEKIITVFGYENYSSSNAPPMSYIKKFSKISQQMYPERLEKMFILEPPFWMRAIFTLVGPFLSKDTKEKIIMVYGKDKGDTIRKQIDPEHAMPYMLEDGKLSGEIDMKRFLHSVQYHCTYDDV